MSEVSVEQECRDVLERMGVPDAQNYSADVLMEMANIFTERYVLRRQLAQARQKCQRLMERIKK